MKQSLKNTLYNVAHSLIIILIMFDIVEFIGRDSFPVEELPFFFGIGGIQVGKLYHTAGIVKVRLV